MKQKGGFNLIWVLSTVVITSIISALTTGVIVYNNYKITDKVNYSDLAEDKELNEFLEVYANIIDDYYEDIDKEELMARAISGMMNYLGDDYTTYMDSDETDSLMQDLLGEYKGIGISLNNFDKTVLEVFENTPASEAGIQVNDIIIGLNDIDVTPLSGSELVDLIREQKDNFTLKLKRGEEEFVVTLKTKKILSPNVSYKVIENTKTGYIKMTSFSATLAMQVQNALTNLEKSGITNLIIDLRNNSGGFLDAAVDVGSMFSKKGQKLFSLQYKDKTTEYFDETEENREYPLVIIVNGETASAAEVLTATLKENCQALIVGETTYGKGRVQQTMKLDDGGMVKYTSAYWLSPNGTNIDEIGIEPDYPVATPTPEEGQESNVDAPLERALNVLNQN